LPVFDYVHPQSRAGGIEALKGPLIVEEFESITKSPPFFSQVEMTSNQVLLGNKNGSLLKIIVNLTLTCMRFSKLLTEVLVMCNLLDIVENGRSMHVHGALLKRNGDNLQGIWT